MLVTERGLYCAEGDFFIDPVRPVARAVITHAHSDHARGGHEYCLCSESSLPLLHNRLSSVGRYETLPLGQSLKIKDCILTFFPAGHILGSVQVRIETASGTTVVTGDHNFTHKHAAAEPYESVRCHTFITECTFGLPIYNWPDPNWVAAEIMRWWQRNSESNHTSIIYAYPLGKTQRLLHMLTEGPGPVGLLGNGNSFLPAYRNAGVPMVPVVELTGSTVQDLRGKGLVIVSASIQNDGLLRQLGKIETAFASGWMAVRSARRQSGYSTGFVLSDHSDWGGLLRAIECSGAERIGLVHGETEPLAHYLRAKGSYQFVGQPGDPGW